MPKSPQHQEEILSSGVVIIPLEDEGTFISAITELSSPVSLGLHPITEHSDSDSDPENKPERITYSVMLDSPNSSSDDDALEDIELKNPSSQPESVTPYLIEHGIEEKWSCRYVAKSFPLWILTSSLVLNNILEFLDADIGTKDYISLFPCPGNPKKLAFIPNHPAVLGIVTTCVSAYTIKFDLPNMQHGFKEVVHSLKTCSLPSTWKQTWAANGYQQVVII